MQHIVLRLGVDYAARRGAWKPELRGFVECQLEDGSAFWLEFAEPSNRPLPELSPEEATDLAMELVKVRRFNDAMELFEAALARSPTLLAARYNRACVLVLSGRVEEARIELADITSREQPHAEPVLNYSALLLSENCNREAEEALEEPLFSSKTTQLSGSTTVPRSSEQAVGLLRCPRSEERWR